MTDPLRSDERPADRLTSVERDARIEQLLLAGLDHYFAGECESAINLWTRVLFLDRQHDRARAYIERARSAQAEQLRESEALVHQGMAAFDAGDVGRARTLLSDAVERGASVDDALGVLGRIDRLGRGAQPARAPVRPSPAGPLDDPAPEALPAPLPARPATSRPGARWALLVVVALGAAAVAAWGLSLPSPSFWPLAPRQAATPAPPARVAREAVPVPLAMEHYLSRARAAFQAGRLRDALRDLDRVPVGDPSRPDADRLRAQIQRELLGVAAAGPAQTPAVVPPTSTVPPPE
ncbi:MAG: tetratricopeptide repeat protein [Vicinamibacterales bacterium]